MKTAPSASIQAAKTISGTNVKPNRQAAATTKPLQPSHRGNPPDRASAATTPVAANGAQTSSNASPSVEALRAKSANASSTVSVPLESSDSVSVGATNAAAAAR